MFRIQKSDVDPDPDPGCHMKVMSAYGGGLQSLSTFLVFNMDFHPGSCNSMNVLSMYCVYCWFCM